MLNLHPVQTPQVDQVATLLLKLETAPADSLRLLPLAVRRLEGDFAYVSCRLQGEVIGLSVEDARLVAYALYVERPYEGADAVAKAFTDAAWEAEHRLESCQAAAPLGFGFKPIHDAAADARRAALQMVHGWGRA